jgi:hypothetical protein
MINSCLTKPQKKLSNQFHTVGFLDSRLLEEEEVLLQTFKDFLTVTLFIHERPSHLHIPSTVLLLIKSKTKIPFNNQKSMIASLTTRRNKETRNQKQRARARRRDREIRSNKKLTRRKSPNQSSHKHPLVRQTTNL